jgi:Fe-S-cluster containining protein
MYSVGYLMVETFYLHLEFTNNKGAWSINLPFLCSKCGVCCTLDDFLTAGEVNTKPEEYPEVRAKLETLFEMLGEIFETSEAKYEQYIMQNPCPFLVDKSCSIYEIRPVGCKLFPNTPFGMLTQNCQALNRFKKMRSILKKGKTTKETFDQVTNEFIKPARLNEKQFQNCIAKLHQAGVTDDELVLFKQINGKNKFQV